ncbi:MAG: hypothetical protein ACKPJD_12930, partial [Planctomycetaceae bacterium]
LGAIPEVSAAGPLQTGWSQAKPRRKPRREDAVAAAVWPIQRRRLILPWFLHYFPGPGFVSA